MSKITQRLWEVYFVVYSFSVLSYTVNFFHPESLVHNFLVTGYAFNNIYIGVYFLFVAQVVFNILFLSVLFSFIFNVHFLPLYIVQALFVFKIVFDCLGHPYEAVELLSFIQTERNIAILIFLDNIALSIPAYIAGFLYAFSAKNRQIRMKIS